MDKLTQLTILSEMLVEAKQATEDAEKEFKRAKANERRLIEEAIPLMMQELGVDKIVLTNGYEVSTKLEVYASITEANKQRAFKWLEENNFGGIIKTEVSVKFDKGEIEKAKRLLSDLLNKDLNAELSESVHAQTLKAFLKEQLSEGTRIPLEYFSAQPVTVATLKKGK